MAKENPKKTVVTYLEEVGATIDDIRTGKHVVIKWTYKGRKFVSTMASTGSDHRGMKNTMARLYRIIRSVDDAA